MKSSSAGERLAGWLLFFAILTTAGLCAAMVGLLALGNGYARRYAGRIYPGVVVFGVDLSGLTPDEAAVALETGLPDPALLPIVLRCGDRTWVRTWADLGMHFEPQASARLAYQVGRQGALEHQVLEQLRSALVGEALAPVLMSPGALQTTRVLQALAPEVDVPPVNASLRIDAGGISPVPAQAGRMLDIEETLRSLPYVITFGTDGAVFDLLIRQVEPLLPNTSQVQGEIEARLAQPLELSGGDRLTGFSGSWTVPPETLAGWLALETVEDESGPRLILKVQEEPIQAYLQALDAQLPGQLEGFPRAQQFGIALDVGVSTHQVRAAVESGSGQAALAFIHPPRGYAVQPGDTLMSIGRDQGFPAWRLVEANPGIDSRNMQPGQEIVLPSVDILFPHPLITEQHILVDISEQRLYAYDSEALLFDFIASTGIASSPTMPGTFQVLSKDEESYASNWDLYMPHFIGVYQSGPDFTNGIHGLPTLSSGARLWAGYLGRPVSFGCVVIGLDEATQLYDWAQVGMLVEIRP